MSGVKNAAVIGGTGFLGTALVTRLRDAGFAVKTLSRTAPVLAGVESIAGDFRDAAALRRTLEGAQAVFHFAGTTLAWPSNENPQEDLRNNLIAAVDLLDACRRAGVRTVVFPSSGGTVYREPVERQPLDESAPTDPISSYGITRLAFEKYLALFHHLHGLDHRILRISNAYGEGQGGGRPQGLVGVALARIARNEAITVWGDGSAVRDYLYVGDIAAACLASLVELPESAPRIFNVSSAQGTSVKEMLAAIEAVTGRTAKVIQAAPRSCDPAWMVLSNRRARSVLGWEPKVTLAEGLQRSWAWTERP